MNGSAELVVKLAYRARRAFTSWNSVAMVSISLKVLLRFQGCFCMLHQEKKKLRSLYLCFACPNMSKNQGMARNPV